MKKRLRDLVVLMIILSLTITPVFGETQPVDKGPLIMSFAHIFNLGPSTMEVLDGKTTGEITIDVNSEYTNVSKGFYDAGGELVTEDVKILEDFTYKIESTEKTVVYDVVIIDPSSIPGIDFDIKDTSVIGSVDKDGKTFSGVKAGITVEAFNNALTMNNTHTTLTVFTSEFEYLSTSSNLNKGSYKALFSNGVKNEIYTFSVESGTGGETPVVTPVEQPFTISNTFLINSVDYDSHRFLGVHAGIAVGDFLSALALADGVSIELLDKDYVVMSMEQLINGDCKVLLNNNDNYQEYVLTMQGGGSEPSGDEKPSPSELSLRLTSIRGLLSSQLGDDLRVYAFHNSELDILGSENIASFAFKNAEGETLSKPVNSDSTAFLEVVANPVDGQSYTYNFELIKLDPMAVSNGVNNVYTGTTKGGTVYFDVKKTATVGDWLDTITIREGVTLIAFDGPNQLTIERDWLIKDYAQNKLYFDDSHSHQLISVWFDMAEGNVEPPVAENTILLTNSTFKFSSDKRKLTIPSPLTIAEVKAGIDIVGSKIASIENVNSENDTLVFSEIGKSLDVTFTDGEKMTIQVVPTRGYSDDGTIGIRFINYDNKTAKIDNFDSMVYAAYDDIKSFMILDDENTVLANGMHFELTEAIYSKATKVVITYFDNRQITFDLSPWNGYVVDYNKDIVKSVSPDGRVLSGVKPGISLQQLVDAVTLQDNFSWVFENKSDQSVITDLTTSLTKDIQVNASKGNMRVFLELYYDIALESLNKDIALIEDQRIILNEVMRPSDLLPVLASNGVSIDSARLAFGLDADKEYEEGVLTKTIIAVGDYEVTYYVGTMKEAFAKPLHDIILSLVEGSNNSDRVAIEKSENVRVYLPENSSFTFNVGLLDQEGNEISSTGNAMFSINNGESVSYDDSSKQLTINTGSLEGNSMKVNTLFVTQGEVTKRIEVRVYKGNLSYVTLRDSKGNLYDGMSNYNLGYDMKQGNDNSTSTNDHVYNGKLYISVMTDIADLAYSTLIVAPEVANQANTKVIELTSLFDKVSNTSINELGSFSFQEPDNVIKVLNSDGTLNKTMAVTVRQNIVREDGSRDGTRITLPNIDGKSYYAQMYDTVVNEASLSVDSNSDDVPNIPEENYDLSKSSEITISREIENLAITVKTPEGLTIVQAGLNKSGKEIGLERFLNNGGSSTSEFFNSGIVKSFVDFVDGQSYRFAVVTDQGDFIEENYESSLPFTIIYHSTAGDYQGQFDDGSTFDYHIDTNGLVTCSISLRRADFYGQVIGNEGLDNVTVTIIDPKTGEEVGSGKTITHQFEDGTNVKGYVVAKTTKTLVGDYLVKYSAPEQSIDYLAGEEVVTFPLTSSHTYIMKKVSIKGNIRLNPQDVNKYRNKINRVYVNVFDMFGNYVTNGRVKLNGEFSVSDLTQGSYFAQVFVSAYSSLAKEYVSSDLKTFVVDESGVASIDLTLKKVMALGKVIDTSSQPVSTWVQVYDADMNEVDYMNSNDQGEFALPLLPDGKYFIQAMSNVVGQHDSLMTAFSVKNGRTNDLHLSLTRTMISGTVSNINGNLANAHVYVYTGEMEFVAVATTDASGQYELGQLMNGEYYLQVVPNSAADGVASEYQAITVTGQSFVHNMVVEEATLIGTAADGWDNKLTNGWVNIYRDGKYYSVAKVDADGHFALKVTDDAKYEVVLIDEDGYQSNSVKEVVSVDTKNLKLKLGNESSISCALNGFTGNEIIKAYLYDEDLNPIGSEKPNAFGVFSFGNLKHGKYHIVIVKNGKLMDNFEFDYQGSRIIKRITVK